MSFTNISSQSVAYFLIILVIFCRTKFLILIKSSLPIFPFMDMALVMYLKSHCYSQSHLGSLMLSSRSFKVLHFTFRSMTYFELMFVYGVKKGSTFILF